MSNHISDIARVWELIDTLKRPRRIVADIMGITVEEVEDLYKLAYTKYVRNEKINFQKTAKRNRKKISIIEESTLQITRVKDRYSNTSAYGEQYHFDNE